MKRTYWLLLTLVVLLRATDLFLTWLYTPDLDTEYNPLVSILGHSWKGLIGTQLLFLIAIALFGAYYFFKPKRNVERPGLNFPDFIYYFFFHTQKPWPQRFFSKVVDRNAHMLFNGFMFLSVAILISLFAILNNSLLLIRSEWYEQFLLRHYSYFFPSVFITIAGLSAILFFGIEYRRYRRSY